MAPYLYDFETSTSPLTTTTAAHETFDYVRLVWIIPTVLGVIAVLFILAYCLFYCVRNTELFFLKHCFCCRRESEDDEHIPLQESSNHVFNQSYKIN